MSRSIVYLTVDDVIAVHELMMASFRRMPEAVRDRGALESAINRVRNAAYYHDADIIEQAVMLAVGLSQSHSFVDGNKRTALLALDTFLGINGMDIKGSGTALELAQWLISIAERHEERDVAIAEFESWLRANVAAS